MTKLEALTRLSDGVVDYNKSRGSKTAIPESIKGLIRDARSHGASVDEAMVASQLSRATISRYEKKSKKFRTGVKKLKSKSKPKHAVRELKIVHARKISRTMPVTDAQSQSVQIFLQSGIRLKVSRETVDVNFLNLLNKVHG